MTNEHTPAPWHVIDGTPRDNYEAHRAKIPNYHDGKPRPTWEQLPTIAQWGWGRPQEAQS